MNIFLFHCFIVSFITIIFMFNFTIIIRNTFFGIFSKGFSEKLSVINGQNVFITYELNAYDPR